MLWNAKLLAPIETTTHVCESVMISNRHGCAACGERKLSLLGNAVRVPRFDLHRLKCGGFFEPLGEVELKGRQQKMNAYSLQWGLIELK
jgi:hypothetical protein